MMTPLLEPEIIAETDHSDARESAARHSRPNGGKSLVTPASGFGICLEVARFFGAGPYKSGR